MNRYDKIKELMSSTEFTEKLAVLSTTEEIQALFSENGVEMTSDEINEMFEMAYRLNENSGELSTDELDDVSGGALRAYVKPFISGCKWGWDAGKKFENWLYTKFGI